jgi:nucleoside-diphosphate-sugar epimerase
MLIVVTGGSGKLGAFVLRELAAAGHQVVNVDLRPPADGGACQCIDLQDAADIRRVMRGADAVCHLANIPFFSGVDPAQGFSNNVAATYNVFDAAHRAGLRRWVNASSIQVYGALGPVQVAPQYLPLDEDHLLLCCDAYPLSKAVGEQIVQTFARRDPGISAFSLRFTYIHPQALELRPTETGHRATGSLFTYVPATEAARAVRLALESGLPGHTPLNIVAARPLVPWSPQALIEAYQQVPSFRRPLRPDEPLICGQRAKQVLGFACN